MTLWIECEHEADAEALKAWLEPIGRQCLLREGLKGRYQAMIMLVDEETIRQTNARTRGIDKVTDVLSFPETAYPHGTARDHPKRLRRALDPDTGCMHLGDIMICQAQADRQAEEYGHSRERELAYLFVHGLCHLLGYDHETPEQQGVMRALEEAALEASGLARVDDSALLEMALGARAFSYSPYSGYAVGACLLAADGRVFTGCNVENASYGLTMCAERSAVYHALNAGARQFTAIAVAAEGSMPYPCGACRQVLREFAPDLRVLVTDGHQIQKTTLEALLPNSFGPEALTRLQSTDEQKE